MFKRIIVALKFNSASRQALEKGVSLARIYGSDLHIFHALDYNLQNLDNNHPTLIEKSREIEQLFEQDIKPLLGDFTNFTFKYGPADPALEVCKLARNNQADLIILGCHQLAEKRCIGRIDYIGMTIMEMASCPVMLVPACD